MVPARSKNIVWYVAYGKPCIMTLIKMNLKKKEIGIGEGYHDPVTPKNMLLVMCMCFNKSTIMFKFLNCCK